MELLHFHIIIGRIACKHLHNIRADGTQFPLMETRIACHFV